MNTVPRNEYPRPSMMRGEDTWMCLNGKWGFEFDFSKSGKEKGFLEKETFSREITVPFSPESELSGIGYTDFMEAVWYKKSFVLPGCAEGKRILLHFGAVDNLATVWINGKWAGEHRGGYTPFSMDITKLLNDGENTVTVLAEDDTRDPLQPSGKQSHKYKNHGCFYTRCTGIWQSVWLEFVPECYIKNVKIVPDVANEKADVTVIFDGYETPYSLRAVAAFDGEPVAEKSVKIRGKSCTFSLDIKNPVLWDIGKGNLYDLTITAGEDLVCSYFGMRSVEIVGHRFLLNGRSIFQRLVLDQGYFKEGIYTAADESDFERDIDLSVATGFNGARMHMKVFEPGFIYAADRKGYLLWGEYPNWGLDTTRVGAFEAMATNWREAVERDFNSPSVIGWCPLNEIWTHTVHEFIRNIYFLTKSLDPTRPVIDISGFMHSEFTDIYDVHDYEQDVKTFKSHYDPLMTGEGEVFLNYPDVETRDEKLPYFVSEFGGTFWDPADVHTDENSQSAWGYGDKPKSSEDFYERFEGLCMALLDNSKICGFCYTQFTDVMQEQNGIYTFDRKAKFDLERLNKIITRKAAIED